MQPRMQHGGSIGKGIFLLPPASFRRAPSTRQKSPRHGDRAAQGRRGRVFPGCRSRNVPPAVSPAGRRMHGRAPGQPGQAAIKRPYPLPVYQADMPKKTGHGMFTKDQRARMAWGKGRRPRISFTQHPPLCARAGTAATGPVRRLPHDKGRHVIWAGPLPQGMRGAPLKASGGPCRRRSSRSPPDAAQTCRQGPQAAVPDTLFRKALFDRFY